MVDREGWGAGEGTYVVVCYQDHAFWERMLDASVYELDLAFDACVAACMYNGGDPELIY